MIYPIISYEDGTEVTASKIDADGQVKVYIEKFDKKTDMFINAELLIPNAKIISSNGYSDEELNGFIEKYSAIQDDIIDYVKEKEKISA
ncbi:MAG: hypothetical protein IJV15_12835 [Lachnospiraceae bacterium]|nr:hypothetical protein [Lachnospiraceae bacterium]